jgi:hypothetical protein
MTCKTASQLGMVLSRAAFSTCKACAIEKAKRCNITNETLGEKATIFNGRVDNALAKIKAPEELKVTTSKPNWHILVDEASGFEQSKFFETKGGIKPYMCKLIFAEVKRVSRDPKKSGLLLGYLGLRTLHRSTPPHLHM